MRNWFARQYEDIRGNFKWGLLMFLWWLVTTYGKRALNLIPHIPSWAVNVGLFVLALFGFIWIATLLARSRQLEGGSRLGTYEVGETQGENTDFEQLFLDEQSSREKYQDQFVKAREERDQLITKLEELEAQKPNTDVTDSDPQLEIKFVDLRGQTISEEWCFDLINRGKHSAAHFACIHDFYIGEHLVAFRNYPRAIRPFGNHDSIAPLYINDPNRKLSERDIFSVFWGAFEALKNPMLYELSVPIRATYQDDAQNLFETRCDLVFYPGEYLKAPHGMHSDKVIEIKNTKLRKVASALTPINWD
jgi:hypothetical protein